MADTYVIKIGKAFVTVLLDGGFIAITLGRARATILRGPETSRVFERAALLFTLEEAKKFIKSSGIGEIFKVQLNPLKLSMSYQDWIGEVEELFEANISTPFKDVEYNWKNAFSSGWTPEEAVEAAAGEKL